MKPTTTIEALESRIAPAAVFVSSKIATYTDVDGDLVKVSFSKAILTTGNVGSIVVETGSGLDNIDLTAAALDSHNVSLAKGTTITVAVTTKVGDGYADVAAITATGIDLGAISMPQSRLVALDCGDDSVDGSGFKVDPTTSIALPSLKVRAFGAVGSHVPTFLNPKLASYVDGDGDMVKVGFSLGILTPRNVASVLVESASGLDNIDLTVIGKNASGVSLAKGISILQTVDNGKDPVTHLPIVIGDGYADVGKLTATGIDLGYVTMTKARLGEIDGIGDGALNGSNVFVDTTTSIALKALSVRAFGISGGQNVPQFVTPNIAKYTDIDGDLVTVKLSKALFNPINVSTVLDLTTNGIETIDMAAFGKTAAGAYRAQGLGLSLTVTSVVGDGKANVGFIDATGIDLGVMNLPNSDLGKIVCGDGSVGALNLANYPDVVDPTAKIGALRGLIVDSMGEHGLTTQGGSGDLQTKINGSLGYLKVTGDVTDSSIEVLRKFTSISIGGDLVGHNVAGQGSIRTELTCVSTDYVSFSGTISIGGDVIGGSATKTGYISVETNGGASAIKIAGDLVGGSASDSGEIYGQKYAIKTVSIGGDVTGGTASKTGYLNIREMTTCSIGGDLVGGSADNTGMIGNASTGTTASSLVIGGNLEGGDAILDGVTLKNSGFILGNFGPVTIKGSVLAGTNDTTTGTTQYSGGMRLGTVSTLTIGGNVTGNIGVHGQKTEVDLIALPSTLNITGNVDYAVIGHGATPSDNFQTAFSYPVKIGTINIGGNMTASNIALGVGAGADLTFGTSDDALPSGAGVYANIAKIIIKGHLSGTVGGTDVYGIQAEQIGSLSVGGVAVALAAGKSNDDKTIGDTGDVRIRELVRP